jgi:hypothetical protein
MEEDAAADRPFIAALAISKARGGLPGPGFFDCAQRLGRFAGDPDGQDARTFHAAELNAVYEYELALRKLVKRKAAGKTIEAPQPAEDTGKVINLMEALRRSVQGGQVPGGSANRSSKKKSARRSGHRHRNVA